MVGAPVLHRLLFFFIVVGLAFSLYSTMESLDPSLESSCSSTTIPFISCASVARSGHTSFGPIPFWFVGLGGFLLLLALDVPLIRTYDIGFLRAIAFLSVLGVGFALYFLYLELAVIHALCPICTGAHLSGVAVLGLSLYLLRLRAA